MGRKVRDLREAGGLSRQVLAERSGVPARTIEGVEKGADPGLSTALKLARALGVTLNDLVDQSDAVERLRLIRLLTDPGETPDDVTIALMQYYRRVMAGVDGNEPG